jgi:cobaltochelatase CobN
LGCGGFFGAQGGLSQAAELLQGKKIANWCADSRDSRAPKIRTISEEINRCLAARLLNPAWLKSMAGHGYKGGAEISRRVSNAYGWLATTGEVDDKALDKLAETFFADPYFRDFLAESNPWALEEIGRRLLEASGRGLWKADPEALAALRDGYLSLEGVLEESVEAYGGDLQGGAVDIITSRDLPAFRKRLDDAREKAGLAPLKKAKTGPS